MDYRIVQREAFKVIGKVFKVSTKEGEELRKIPEIWCECNSDGTCMDICSIDSRQNMLGICMDFEHDKEQFSYMVAIENVKDITDTDFTVREIPVATWAVFPSVGAMPQSIQKVWARIFQEWLPTADFKHADAPELEVYFPGDPSAEDYKCEVWIPIIKIIKN
ncbi:GyrI-like domain-containing protein [Pelosinus sp. sgz500959]|uniref:GyrI-like domain-containing protein n=1 Tax=Pelosinus sp. sgz500959 TaxID=3242472 RepID=UPI00366AEDCD